MRITKLKIVNFKNFTGENEFDFSKKIIMLYGANGYGKSTIFEAIEWCLTSQIEKYLDSEHDLRHDLANKSLLGKSAFQVEVRLSFEEFEIVKSFSVYEDCSLSNTSSKLITLAGEKISGVDNIEVYLKSISQDKVSYSKGIYNQLLKKSYILSQDQISNFVKSPDNASRYKALADIMGLKPVLLQFENFKNVITKINKKRDLLHIKKEDIYKSISLNKEFIQNFDENEYLRVLSKLDILNEIEDEKEISEQKIDLIISKRLERKNLINNFNEIYKTLDDYINQMSFIQIRDSLKEIDKEIHLKKLNFDRAHKILDKVILKEKNVLEFKKNINEIQVTYEMIQDNKNKLKQLELNDAINEKDLGSIDKTIRELENYSFILDFTLEYKKFIHEKSPKNLDNKSSLKRLNEKIEINNKKIYKRSKWLEKIQIVGENEKEFLINRLVSGLEDIQSYIVNTNIDVCPVCSTKKNDLQGDIKDNLYNKIEYLNKSNQKYEKINNLRTRILESDLLLKNSNNKIKESIRHLNKDINEFEIDLETYMGSKYYYIEHTQKSFEIVQQELKNTSIKIDQIKKGKHYILEINRLNKILNNYNHGSKYNNIEMHIIKINKSDHQNQKRKSVIEKYINDLNKSLESLDKDLNKLKSVTEKLKIIKDDEKNLSINQLYKDKSLKLITIQEDINDLNLLKTIVTKKQINKKTEKELHNLHKLYAENDKEIAHLEDNIAQLKNYQKNKELTLGESVLDYLNQDTFSIKQYFKFLNPLPGDGELVFTGTTNEISVQLDYRKNASIPNGGFSNAEKIMSSGQLNVLALSIFLAINQEQKIHPFDFIGIDDPIQNMDDVNQFTVCDVLSQIDKQLIFSTHDKKFLKLFINKNDTSNIIVYNLNSPYMDSKKIEKITFN